MQPPPSRNIEATSAQGSSPDSSGQENFPWSSASNPPDASSFAAFDGDEAEFVGYGLFQARADTAAAAARLGEAAIGEAGTASTASPPPALSGEPSVLGTTSTNIESTNWSGAVITASPGESFSTVSAQWVIPTIAQISGVTTSDVAEWVGIDGYESSDVCQAGVYEEAQTSNGQTTLSCQAWVEWYPANAEMIPLSSFDVNPGDTIKVTVETTGAGATEATFILDDETTGKTYETSLAAPNGTSLQGNSAEAIVETPELISNSGQESQPPLADFLNSSPVTFNDVSATYSNGSAASLSSAQSIGMWTDNNDPPGVSGSVQEAYGSIQSASDSVTVTENDYWGGTQNSIGGAEIGTINATLQTQGDVENNSTNDLVWRASNAQATVWAINTSGNVTSTNLGTIGSTWQILNSADYLSNSTTQMLVDSTADGTMCLWSVNGNGSLSGIDFGQYLQGNSYVASGKFTTNGTENFLVDNQATNSLYVWWIQSSNDTVQGTDLGAGLMQDNTVLATGNFFQTGETDFLVKNQADNHMYDWWVDPTNDTLQGLDLGAYLSDNNIMATGNFLGNGTDDMLVQNTVDDHMYVWWIASNGQLSGIDLGNYWSNIQLLATGNFAGSQEEMITRDTLTNETFMWWVNSQGTMSGVDLGNISSQWQVVTTGDYNASGYDGIIWQNTSTGQVELWDMGSFSGPTNTTMGAPDTSGAPLGVLDQSLDEGDDDPGDVVPTPLAVGSFSEGLASLGSLPGTAGQMPPSNMGSVSDPLSAMMGIPSAAGTGQVVSFDNSLSELNQGPGNIPTTSAQNSYASGGLQSGLGSFGSLFGATDGGTGVPGGAMGASDTGASIADASPLSGALPGASFSGRV